MSEQGIPHRHEPPRFYEALGRVMGALRDCHALNGARHLDWWPALAGRERHIEWQGGPYAYKVAGALFAAVINEDYCPTLRGALTHHEFHSTGRTRSRFEVLNVPIVLRALDPVGADEAFGQAVRHLRQTDQQPTVEAVPA